MAKTKFNHIDDCWDAITECETIQEVQKVLGEIPNKFGSWWIAVTDNGDGDCYEITNSYWDSDAGGQLYESAELEVPFDEDFELEDYNV